MNRLNQLLQDLTQLFPAEAPLALKPAAESSAWGVGGARFTGHARRWFEATDGQADELPAYACHAFVSLAEALETVEATDALREEPEGYWVEASWLTIAYDGAGQSLMIDDADGRVLGVTIDDDHVDVLAASPEEWLESLVQGQREGKLIWDSTFGLMETAKLADMEAFRAEVAERKQAPLSTRDKLRLGLALSLTLGLMALLIWWLESRR